MTRLASDTAVGYPNKPSRHQLLQNAWADRMHRPARTNLWMNCLALEHLKADWVKEDRMRQKFWTSLSQTFIAAVTVVSVSLGACTSENVFAQTETTVENKPKKTLEPVFRISKLRDPAPVTRPEPATKRNIQPARIESAEIPSAGPDRLANSSSLPILNPVNIPAAAPTPKIAAPAKAPHPLDRALETAHMSLSNMRSEINDYSAILAKREQINGVVGDPSYMNVKIRCPRNKDDGTVSPFSIYMKFLKPKEFSGREVIWVDGQNDNKLMVHEAGGLIGMRTFHLDPCCILAMRGQRYPIYEAGLENLIVKLIEKAERDRAAGPCTVNYKEGAEINKRKCSLIELVHEERRPPYEFHKAQVFIDDELQLPVRYAAFDWPKTPGEDPLLIEEYTYYNVKVNIGLNDRDFDPKNPAYKFPRVR